MFGMKEFHISASGAIQGHHGPLVLFLVHTGIAKDTIWKNHETNLKENCS